MKRWLIAFVCLLMLTGCWDERQFKNIKLVLSMGYDVGEDGGIIQTVSIPSVRRSVEGPGEEKIQVISTSAHTPREARDKLDQMISETFDPSKVKVIVLGEELAKKNIYPILDEMYRNPNSNLNSFLAIAEGGTAKDVINTKNLSETRISQYLSGLLDAAVYSTHATGENLQLICAELVEPGIDFSVPMVTVDEEKQLITFSGMGLFHDKQYSGEKIAPEQTTLYMLLQGKKGKIARMTAKVSDKHEEEIQNYVTVNVMNNNKDLKLEVKDNQVTAHLKLKMKVRIVEYPSDHLYVKGKIGSISKELSEVLTSDSEQIISQIQEANSDILGIGRRVKAFHPKVWKELDWNEEYPEITIKPKVEVEILQHGIIN
ncbi:Ger(x)C family spore germination protein [Halobacillus litoralis]|uniref:Ger(X)C family spore germination protein n=1 Tax=Halobacillus litoralis TaxID=45668 RepID=A0A410MAP2_9BACI|nr:Ger(x)C family spore germination protein [Halobacillus litoralis]QAS51791.1 Ger(x)C family spore germination protein [Halobacillus litoralis]